MVDAVHPALLITSLILWGTGFLLAYLYLPPAASLATGAVLMIVMPSFTFSMSRFPQDTWPLLRNTAICICLYNLPERFADRLIPSWARLPDVPTEEVKLNEERLL